MKVSDNAPVCIETTGARTGAGSAAPRWNELDAEKRASMVNKTSRAFARLCEARRVHSVCLRRLEIARKSRRDHNTGQMVAGDVIY